MSSRNQALIIHPARGGLDTTTPPTLLQPDQLTLADNVEYDTSGVRRKRLGTTRYHTAQLTTGGSGATITALADFWRHGTCLDGSQQFVAHAGTTLYKDDGDATWDVMDATTSWGTSGSETTITIAGGYAIFANGDDAPRAWDQSALSTVAGAPYFSFASYHLARLFVGGYAAQPSHLWYTAAGNVLDFTGEDSGTLRFDPDDGDRITGISQPFQGRLYIFKGPNGGSVWNLSGNTPLTFTKTRMFNAAPCVSHRSIITTPDDIYWASRHGIHALTATAKYGDTEQAYLSHPIQDQYRALADSGLSRIVGFYHPTRNIAGWFCPEGGQNSVGFIFNYVLKTWSVWRFSGFNPASCMVAITPTTRRSRLYIGGYDGYVRAGDQTVKSDDVTSSTDGLSYEYRLRTPIYQRFSEAVTELSEKQFYGVTTFYSPVATDSSVTVTYYVDQATGNSGTTTFSMLSGADILDDTFTLDESWLDGEGGMSYHEWPIEGRGRSIQVEWTQTATNSDVEILGYAVRYAAAESHAMERAN